MPATFHLSALACAIGAAVFATVSGASRLAWVTAGIGLLATLISPQAVTAAASSGATGLVLLTLAIARLAGWDSKPVLGLAAGALAGSWAALLQTAGAPIWAAAALAVAVPAVAVAQSRRRDSFAPPRLCEDALLVVALVAVCAAAAPGLVDGWRAAVNLKFGGASQAAAAVPVWAIAVSLAAAAAGAGYSAWSRR